jgi:hypothetical protein
MKNIIRPFLFWISILTGLPGIIIILMHPVPSNNMILTQMYYPMLMVALVCAWAYMIMGRMAEKK